MRQLQTDANVPNVYATKIKQTNTASAAAEHTAHKRTLRQKVRVPIQMGSPRPISSWHRRFGTTWRANYEFADYHSSRLMRVVIEEAERNPNFESALQDALDSTPSKRKQTRVETSGQVKDGKVETREESAGLPPRSILFKLCETANWSYGVRWKSYSLEQLRDIGCRVRNGPLVGL